MKTLQGKIAIVTGGTQGIGKAIAEHFAAEGADVMTCARSADEGFAEAMSNGRAGQVAFCATDMKRLSDIEQMVEETLRRLGKPSIVVNNAAAVIFRHAGAATVEDFEQTFQVNVRGYWWLCRTAYPHMKEADGGAVINIASTHPYRTKANHFPYNASKGAILAMNKAMAVDFGTDDIRVNAVVPGIIDTRPTREWLSGLDDPAAKRSSIEAAHPLGRMPSPDEVARAALFLASPDASAITGIELRVDAGREVQR